MSTRLRLDPGLRPLLRALPGHRTRVRLAAAGIVLIGVVLLLAVLLALDPAAFRGIDDPAGLAAFRLGEEIPLVAAWARAWSFLVDGPRNAIIVGAASLLLVVGRAWPWAAFLVIVSQGGVLLSNLLKIAVARPRPEMTEQHAGQATMSFPSGHSFSGVVVWGTLALSSLYLVRRPWGPLVAAGFLAIGLLQPLARVVLARHWLTDTIGGQLLGLGWLLVGWSLFTWLLARGLSAREAEAEAEAEATP